MSEFNESGVLGDAEQILKPSFPVVLNVGTVDYFLKAMNDGRTLAGLDGTHAEYKIDEIKRSVAHTLFERLEFLRQVSIDTQAEELQIPLKELEYKIMRDMGSEGRGYSENEPTEAKRNIQDLDHAFTKAKKDAGATGPIERFLDRLRGH
jgi:hypothetical protein